MGMIVILSSTFPMADYKPAIENLDYLMFHCMHSALARK